MNKLIFPLVALIALPVLAQPKAQPGPRGGMPPEVMEMMQKQARIMAVQKQALNDPALQAEQKKLQAFIEAEIVKAEPKQKKNLARMHTLETELKAAAKAKDNARGQKLMAEAQELVKQLDPIMRKTMQKPAVEKKLKAFEKKVEKKMAEIDPEVPKLIKEMEAAMAKMGGPGGAPHGGPMMAPPPAR